MHEQFGDGARTINRGSETFSDTFHPQIDSTINTRISKNRMSSASYFTLELNVPEQFQ